MSLRIACDLDGTLADMDAALQREARRMFGPDVNLHASAEPLIESAEDVEAALGSDPAPEDPVAPAGASRPLTRSELRRLWAEIRKIDDFWCALGEIEPGAVARFAALSQRYGWEVIFVTQRPSSEGDTTQRQSQRWLQSHGFEMPAVFVTGGRGRVAKALSLDVVIDDRPENCLDVVADSSALPLLVWRRTPQSLPLLVRSTTIDIVPSFTAVLDRLEQLTTERERRRTLLGRVRSAIGL
jgi:hypothetical protein